MLQPDMCHAGGITEVRLIAGMAEAYYADVAPHNPLGPISLAAGVQLSASIPNFLCQEQVSLGEGYLSSPFMCVMAIWIYRKGRVWGSNWMKTRLPTRSATIGKSGIVRRRGQFRCRLVVNWCPQRFGRSLGKVRGGKMSTIKLWLILSALVCVVLCAPGMAQVASAELSGTVLDSSGAAVANVKVTATNTATNLAREGVTDGSGRYVITLLPAGDYTVSAEAPGFRKLVQSGLVLQINQQARLDLSLELGHASETVEVTAQAPLLESESSSLGTVVNQKLVNQLPLNGRNFIQLATLSPGVNGVGYSASGTIMGGTRPDDRRPATEIFSNGNREGSNNFLYDGIDDNERLTLSIVLRPAVEAVREFKIQTNLYSADIGRNSGAVVDVITKSGTNKLHGSLFEFLRNSAMDSRSFFSPKGTAFPSLG